MTFQYLKGDYKQEGNEHFTQVDSNRTRGNGFQLKEGKFRLVVGGRFLLSEVRCWSRLPGETVDAHHWRRLRPSWMGPWQPGLVGVSAAAGGLERGDP